MAKLIVLMGPTGAGKSVQGAALAEQLGGVRLSSGSLLRRDPQIAALISNGSLAPAEVVEKIVADAIDAVPANQPIILDGFPRTMSNVKWMDEQLPEHNRELVAVVLIELDLKTSLHRLGLRGRADDAPESVQEKWELYAEKTRPVIEHYEQLGLLRRIDGRGTVEEVHELIRRAVA